MGGNQSKTMHYIGIIIIIAVVFYLIFSTVTLSPAGISLQPIKSIANTGNFFTVNVYLKAAEDVKGFQFDLSYDPSVLEVVEVSEGGFLGSDGRQTFWVEADTAEMGIIKHPAGVIIGSGTGITGEGVLASVKFMARQPGSSDLMFTGVKITNSRSQLLNIPLTNGVAQVI